MCYDTNFRIFYVIIIKCHNVIDMLQDNVLFKYHNSILILMILFTITTVFRGRDALVQGAGTVGCRLPGQGFAHAQV